jgi:GMP synthase-like glutamine amidotransferase
MSGAPALVLQTQDNCPPGLVCQWARSRGVELDVLRVDRWVELPDPREYSCAIALGSYASVARSRLDWVTREIDWIQRADAAGVPVLGICFGAQALAVALGGSVRRLSAPEFAWVEVETYDPTRVPPGPWLALHEDAITLPPLAYELASGPSGPQAFTLDRHLGVQFHPEATSTLLASWISDRRDILADVSARLLAGARDAALEAHAGAARLFDGFAAQAGLRIRDELALR